MEKEQQLECHHFVNPDEIVCLGSIHQRLLKSLGDSLIQSFMVNGSG